MKMNFLSTAVFASLLGASAFVAAGEGKEKTTPATIPPGQVVPADPVGDAPRGDTVSTVAHATRDFKALDTNKDGMIGKTELSADNELTTQFSDFDTDVNDSLSREEFDAYVLQSQGIDPDEDEEGE